MQVVKARKLIREEVEPGYRKYRIVKTTNASGGFYYICEYRSQNEWIPVVHRTFSTKQKCIDELDYHIKQYLTYRVVEVEPEDYSIKSHINDFNNNKG